MLTTSVMGLCPRSDQNIQMMSVKVQRCSGDFSLFIRGLNNRQGREMHQRVWGALIALGGPLPIGKYEVKVDTEDAELVHCHYLDLAVFIGVVTAARRSPQKALQDRAFFGGLNFGAVTPVDGALLAMQAALDSGYECVMPQRNLGGAKPENRKVFGASNIHEVLAHLSDGSVPKHTDAPPGMQELANVPGNSLGKLAAMVIASGRHPAVFEGPVGAPCTKLALAVAGCLPFLDFEQQCVAEALRAHAGQSIDRAYLEYPPLRAPHFSTSIGGLCGTHDPPIPGELCLGNDGVVVFDEITSFESAELYALEDVMDTGEVRLQGNSGEICYPARALIVATRTRCPCGLYGTPGGCNCSPQDRERHLKKLPDSLEERFDLRVEVPWEEPPNTGGQYAKLTTTAARERVVLARKRQKERSCRPNARLRGEELVRCCPMEVSAKNLLVHWADQWCIGSEQVERVTRVARTLADLDNIGLISLHQVLQSLVLCGFSVE